MQPFRNLKSLALPIPQPNVDTDQILPARFLHKPRKDGYSQYLFRDLRRLIERPEFPQPKILIAAENFGCGSSRENAVWALADYGFRVIIAPSFGDIFYSNCLKNGLLPVPLRADVVAAILAATQPQTLYVDLFSQTVTIPDGTRYGFDIDLFAKQCLLRGVDELGYTLTLLPQIEEFEKAHPET
ncbi:MAG TPA: 3-isopropylmalate dehydratase small subunit [Bryobacteraceae bacterium]|jgi:3-isopropylmalate/(R)-2-methylmalate dehydratase small subunit